MLRLTLRKKAVDAAALYKRWALEEDASLTVSEDAYIELEWASPIALLTLDSCEFTAKELSQIRWNVTKRLSGLSTSAKIFGYQGRIGIRENYCHSASLAKESPRLHEKLTKMAVTCSEYMAEHFPKEYAYQDSKVRQVLEEWRIPGSVFTSGIINNRNALNYHLDSGNYEKCLSAMIVMQRGTSGGNLVLPEYDAKISFEGEKPRLIIFDGQGILHGVTPINYLTPDAHRYSVVYYPLKSLWKCLPPKEELAFARKSRVESERKKAALVKAKLWKS